MKKFKSIIAFIAALLIIQGISTPEVFAKSNADLEGIQNERKEIQENLTAQEKKVNELYTEIENLNEKATRLNNLLSEKQSRVDEITYEIDTTVEEIAALQEEIEELTISIEQRFELLKTRAASYQSSGGLINYIEVLFGAQSFGDFITRLTAVNQIMDSDATLMEQLEADIKLVEKHQTSTMEKLDELNEMHDEQEAELAQIEAEKQEQEKTKKALNDKQQELIAHIGELKAEDGRLKSMEDEVKREIAEAAKREREEREQRRLAQQKAAEEEAERKAAKVKQQEESELVHVSKVEEKVNNNKTNSSATAAPQQSQAKTTKKVQNTTPKQKAESEPKSNSKTFTVTSTAYTANCNGCSGITSTGINLKKNPNTKVIAVDPSVIPLGSVVHVEGYGYAIAGDTGGAIRGNKIDVFLSSKSAASNWGVRTVKVTIQ